jgi:hypothetical protein
MLDAKETRYCPWNEGRVCTDSCMAFWPGESVNCILVDAAHKYAQSRVGLHTRVRFPESPPPPEVKS